MAVPTPVRGEGKHIEFFREGKVPIVGDKPPVPGLNEVLVYCRMKGDDPVFYIQESDGTERELGPGEFLSLSDTPNSYTPSDMEKLVRVNAAGTAIEFVTHDKTGDPHEQYAFDHELPHEKGQHTGPVLTGVDDEVLGAHYLELAVVATPSGTPANTRRIFVAGTYYGDAIFATDEDGNSIALDRPFPIITFPFPRKKMANDVFLPRPAYPLTDKILGPNANARQNIQATAGVAGGAGGQNEINLESTTSNPFTGSPAWTLRKQIVLGTGKLITGVVDLSAWVYRPTVDYIRFRASDVDLAQPPEDVVAYFEWDFFG